MSPWSVNHPARWVGRRALVDRDWQNRQRRRLGDTAPLWQASLAQRFPRLAFAGCGLFATGFGDWETCRALYRTAGERGLLLRLMGPRDGRGLVRFGLPSGEEEARVAAILDAIACSDRRQG